MASLQATWRRGQFPCPHSRRAPPPNARNDPCLVVPAVVRKARKPAFSDCRSRRNVPRVLCGGFRPRLQRRLPPPLPHRSSQAPRRLELGPQRPGCSRTPIPRPTPRIDPRTPSPSRDKPTGPRPRKHYFPTPPPAGLQGHRNELVQRVLLEFPPSRTGRLLGRRNLAEAQATRPPCADEASERDEANCLP